MRLTYPTALVLQALLDGRHHGFDIMDATGLSPAQCTRLWSGSKN